ncbi:MAG: NTP transferase domain-containing protein [Candidatus Pacebacteria bacterium]|nr:NTP transferase domain-containing protein [Candidatus Paceibacterota bacterium]
MITIILAGGRGARMAPLTDTLPKPMLKVLDKNLLEWKLKALPDSVTKIVFVVGYLGDKIREHFENFWNGIPVEYIEQHVLDGTGGAIALCEQYIEDRALVLMGDDIYHKDDLEALAKHPFSILVMDKGEEAKSIKAGKVVEKNGLFIGLNEGLAQTGIETTLINTGAYTISKEYFNYEKKKVSDTEFGLPQTLVEVSLDHPIKVLKTKNWIQITTPQCLKKAESHVG